MKVWGYEIQGTVKPTEKKFMVEISFLSLHSDQNWLIMDNFCRVIFSLCHPAKTTYLWKEVYLSRSHHCSNQHWHTAFLLISRSRSHTWHIVPWKLGLVRGYALVVSRKATRNFHKSQANSMQQHNNYFVKTLLTLISYLHISSLLSLYLLSEVLFVVTL